MSKPPPLVSNDGATPMAMYWTGPKVMRYGVTENLYGPEELAAFRKVTACSESGSRTVKRLDIVSFGKDFASITLEFERSAPSGCSPWPVA